MQKPTLVIMAAGMGSRFGGLKQMTPVDEQGHFIMDFSIYDAFRAGFGKVVCIIKEEMRDDFEEKIGKRVRPHGQLVYAFQNLDMLPEGFSIPEGRVKPWGTSHAVLCAAKELDGPFAVINADDFYGYEAFEAIANFLKQDRPDTEHAMVGYALSNTLTEHGSVSRGVCEIDDKGYLVSVTERLRIEKTPNGPAYTEDGETFVPLAADSVASMNLWGFQKSVLARMETNFVDFLRNVVPTNPMKAEYLLPHLPAGMIKDGTGTVQVLTSDARWFGVTYQEDLPGVVAAIRAMKDAGKYPENLW